MLAESLLWICNLQILSPSCSLSFRLPFIFIFWRTHRLNVDDATSSLVWRMLLVFYPVSHKCSPLFPSLIFVLSCSVMSNSLWPHGQAPLSAIFQARKLEWVAISFSRASSWPRGCTCVSCLVSPARAGGSSPLHHLLVFGFWSVLRWYLNVVWHVRGFEVCFFTYEHPLVICYNIICWRTFFSLIDLQWRLSKINWPWVWRFIYELPVLFCWLMCVLIVILEIEQWALVFRSSFSMLLLLF